jgi:hypothetical protein
MKVQILALVMTFLIASIGYVVYDDNSETNEEILILQEYEWMDVNQFHDTMGSGYENTTDWVINTTGVISITIDLDCFFDTQDDLTGYVNISILDNDSLVWSDTTSNSTDYTVNHAVSGDSNLTIRVRAVGSDTYPEHDFADWFVVGLTATLTNR